MRFELFGPIQILDDGSAVALPTGKLRLLLAVLLSSANRPVSVATLAETVWRTADPEPVRRTVRWHIHRLRGLLGGAERIGWDGGGYRMTVAAGELDLDEFRQLCETGIAARREGRPAEAKRLLDRALRLRRGPVYAELVDDSPWLAAEAAALERLHLEASEHWIGARLELGEHERVLARLTELVERFPHREPLRAQLMRALFHCGRQVEALEVFRGGREILTGELGLEPGPELQRTHREILAGQVSRRTAEPVVIPRELPGALPAFAGRDGDLDDLAAALSEPAAVVAISGPGGVGKSALAVQLAHRVAESFPDGQLYVNLRGNTPNAKPIEADAMLSRFLRSLGAAAQPPTDDIDELATQLRTAVAGKRLLFVLDDAHDVGRIRPLLPPGRGSAVVVTSRRALPLLNNVTHRAVGGLDERESLALLAGHLGADRVAAEAAAAADLARWCAGIPLALNICAARIAARPHWTIGVLAELLAEESGRLSALAEGDVTVRSSFEISYRELFDDPDGIAASRLFRLLGLYPGNDIGVPAAAALAGLGESQTWALLESLVDARLLEPLGEKRYRQHDLLRLFARELAGAEFDEGERTTAVRRLLHFYCETACEAMRTVDPVIKGPHKHRPASPLRSGLPFADEAAAMAWVAAEAMNVRSTCQVREYAAIDTAAAYGACLALKQILWDGGDRRELKTLAVLGIEIADASRDAELRTSAASMLAQILRREGRLAQARGLLLDVVAADDGSGAIPAMCGVYGTLASVSRRLGELDRARDYAERSIELSRRLGSSFNESRGFLQLGFIHEARGDTEAAIEAHDRAYRVARKGGARNNEIGALGNIAHVLRRASRIDAAMERFESALHRARELSMERTVPGADLLWGLADCHRQAGRTSKARRYRRESADLLLAMKAISEAEHRTIVTTDDPPVPAILI